ncbi:hypothetical protein L5169_003598 [Vibrio parahaemolyticus]|nr:hypothetical protein [Vibrio parahaemolyticus]ELP2657983.1 hypothetical protein [Vibrio parahaemolyticus]
MTKNTNQKHPIAKLINLIILLFVVVAMTFATIEFFARGWCQKAHGTPVDKNSSWELRTCAKYYWDMDLENPNGW